MSESKVRERMAAEGKLTKAGEAIRKAKWQAMKDMQRYYRQAHRWIYGYYNPKTGTISRR